MPSQPVGRPAVRATCQNRRPRAGVWATAAPPPPAVQLGSGAGAGAPLPVPRLPGQLPFVGIMSRASIPKSFIYVMRQMREHRLRMAEAEIMGLKAVRVRHPEDIVRVAIKDHEKYGKVEMKGAVGEWLGDGLVANKDPANHAAVRGLMNPAFRPEAIRGYCGMFTAVADRLAAVMLESEGRPLDIEPLMQRATLDVIGLAGMSYDFRAVEMASRSYRPAPDDIDAGAVWKGMMPAAMLLSLGLPVPERMMPGRDDFVRGVEALDKAAARMMVEHRAGRITGNRRSVLTFLLEAQAEDNQLMTNKQIRDELMTLMLAGSDTTATTLAFCCWELSRRPDVMARLAAEVDSALGGREGPVVADDIARMPFLVGCVNETLRCYSAAPNFRRVAKEDCVLGGYAIPKGSRLLMDIWALHRHEDYWPQPDEWLPERWLPENAATLGPNASTAFLPFSVGPRSCIGRYFALLEAQVMLAQLVRRVQLAEAPGQPPMGLVQQITLASESGIYVVPRPRPAVAAA